MLPGSIPPGSRLGGYRIIEELGRGGMGVVLKAEEESLGRSVAIKVLPRDLVSDAKRLERFRREAKGAAAVVHPNITTLYAHGEANGWPYIAFEFMAGGSVWDKVKKTGPLPWREVARIGAAVAHALGAIHDAGLIHRDLKPANILLDAAGRAKLGDFGLVRREQRGGSLTGAGELVGTAAFLAPEQAGDEGIDHRADLYALGATLYAMVTGAPPFEGEGLAVIAKHLTTRPTPPSQEVPGLPKAFDKLILRLLEKKPAARGDRAEDVARELEALIAAEPSAHGTVAARSSRAPLLAGGLIGLAGLAAAAVALALGSSPRTPPPPPVAPAAALRVRIDEPRPGDPVPPGVPVVVRAHVENPPEKTWFKANGSPVPEARFELSLTPLEDGSLTVTVEGSDGSAGAATVKVAVRLPLWFVDLDEAHKPKRVPGDLHPTAKKDVYVWLRRRDVPVELVYVPVNPGVPFTMGHDLGANPADNLPAHAHWLARSYWIGRFEVTWAQFDAFCKATGTPLPPRPEWYGQLLRPTENPVVGVNWNQSNAFCEWLALRLPTEAEWEHAARGDDGKIFPWGDRWDENHFGNFNDKSCPNAKSPQETKRARQLDDHSPYTAPVGSFEVDVSPFGAYDMAGNASEWCADWFRADIYARWAGDRAAQMLPPERDDKKKHKAVRGGSWAFPTWGMAAPLRGQAHTDPDDPNVPPVIGLRVALTEE